MRSQPISQSIKQLSIRHLNRVVKQTDVADVCYLLGETSLYCIVLMLSADDGSEACGLAKSRSRREKREKVGRKTALEQLKKAKMGEKIKYEV